MKVLDKKRTIGFENLVVPAGKVLRKLILPRIVQPALNVIIVFVFLVVVVVHSANSASEPTL